MRQLLTLAVAAVALLVAMAGLYWLMDVLPLLAFAGLVIAFAAMSHRDQRRGDAPRGGQEPRG